MNIKTVFTKCKMPNNHPDGSRSSTAAQIQGWKDHRKSSAIKKPKPAK